MATIYLVQQGTTLRKEQGRFLIETDLPDEEMLNAEVLIQEVERILVFGTIHLTTAAISVCLDHHIPVIFLSQSGDYRNGRV